MRISIIAIIKPGAQPHTIAAGTHLKITAPPTTLSTLAKSAILLAKEMPNGNLIS